MLSSVLGNVGKSVVWQSWKVSVQAYSQLHLQFLSSDEFQVALDSHIPGIYNTNETCFFQKQWHVEKNKSECILLGLLL